MLKLSWALSKPAKVKSCSNNHPSLPLHSYCSRLIHIQHLAGISWLPQKQPARSSHCAFSTANVFRKSSKCAFHHSTISPVRRLQFSSPAEHSLSQAMLSLPELLNSCQNLKANWKGFFFYSLTKLFPYQIFSSATTGPAVLLALQYSSTAFGDPWANQVQNGLYFQLNSFLATGMGDCMTTPTISPHFRHNSGLFIDASTKSNFWQTTKICMWPKF